MADIPPEGGVTAAPDPVPGGFRALMAVLAQTGTDASDRGDEPGFQRAFAFRGAIRRMADRWAAGDASPVRSSAKKEG